MVGRGLKSRWVVLSLLVSAASCGSVFGQTGVLKPQAEERTPSIRIEPRSATFADAVAGAAAHLLPTGPEVPGTSRMPRRTFAQSASLASNQIGYETAYLAEQFVAGFRPQRVIDNDWTRVKNTQAEPYKAVCLIEIRWPHKAMAVGSAFFVGKRVLVTNAHCLYDRKKKKWATSIRVLPGQDGNVSPFGAEWNSDLYIPTEYISSNSTTEWNYDIGWIVLPSRSMFNKVGFTFGYMHTTDAKLTTMNLNNAGYPGSKDQQQWKDYETRSQVVRAMEFDHYLDIQGGSSGSPMYWIEAGERYAVGVNASESTTIRENGATRMTKTYYDWTKQFTKQYP